MPHVKLNLKIASLLLLLLVLPAASRGQGKRRAPAGGRAALVVDERLSALRDAPSLDANLLRRLGRGSVVTVAGSRTRGGGVTFLKVLVTRRTGGWVQSDALARPWVAGEDARLWRLVRGSEDFDRLARARIFLDAFPHSALRPAALLDFGDAAEAAAARLSREAARRLDAREMEAGGAPHASYFLNYNGLDRLNRLGVKFIYDDASKQFHYDGAAWREILARHPRSPEAAEARRRLENLRPNARR
ncbi:MAG: hypothetical protein ABW250_27995 [Pyrinomonadaceae bacterium]